jgi:aladin
METGIPLRRVGGGGVSLLKWSPDGSKVFSATPSHLFRYPL